MNDLSHLNPLERQLYEALKDALVGLDHFGPSLPPGHVCGPESQCDGLCMDVASFSREFGRYRAALAAAETPPEAPYYPDKGERYQTLVWGDVIEANASREDYERESTARIAIGKAPFKYRPAKEGGYGL